MALPSAEAYGALHSLQVSSGVALLPVRVLISTFEAAGVAARQPMRPQRATVSASWGAERYAPLSAWDGSRRYSLPTLLAATTSSRPATAIAVTCEEGSRAISVDCCGPVST